MKRKHSISCLAFRLRPGDDLKKSVLEIAKSNAIESGVIISAVGSLRQLHLRFASRKKGTLKKGFFEIISLSGTVSGSSCHLHALICDKDGKSSGGHVLDGNIIFTTAEITIGIIDGLVFLREQDPETGFAELVVKTRKGKR
jgi:predicted DNA-binding protein with PD1-like motif